MRSGIYIYILHITQLVLQQQCTHAEVEPNDVGHIYKLNFVYDMGGGGIHVYGKSYVQRLRLREKSTIKTE